MATNATDESQRAIAKAVAAYNAAVQQFGGPAALPRYLIDNSVWARLSTSPDVVAALKAIVDFSNPTNLLICPPIALEVGFSARNGRDHTALHSQLTAFPQCTEHPTVDESMELQNRLWNGGLVRAAGATDTSIAAYALKNDATVLHYDQDFEHLAKIEPTLKHQWIVPRGSIV